VVNIFAFVTKTVGITIEYRRLLRCVGVLWPVPVGCVALVATFFTKCLFVDVDKPSVPSEEVASVVNAEGLLDVSDNEVIKL
jgi:hypothetical protein